MRADKTNNIAEVKEVLRRKALQRRTLAHKTRYDSAASAVKECFLENFGDQLSSAIVSLYWPICGEIDVRPLIYALVHKEVCIALPALDDRNRPLVFRTWKPGAKLVNSGFGFMQPLSEATALLPTHLLVPLLGFDKSCNRLGYGGGYYDRSLKMLRRGNKICAIGAAYDEQEFIEIPVTRDDQHLDVVITDRRKFIYRA